jgi:putative phosphoribosyl transferase
VYFNDRYDAALQLAPRLEKYRKEDGVILAVPRGGVPIGAYLARFLGYPIDLLMTKKIGHPFNKEYAIGAVSPAGSVLNDTVNVPEGYIDSEIKRIRAQLLDSYKKFMGNRPPAELEGKTVIIIDDGVATGQTMLASIKMIRDKNPRKIVVAVPVAAAEAAEKIKQEADELVCLYVPDVFYGVGMFYDDFTQVEDEEVTALLKDMKAGYAEN